MLGPAAAGTGIFGSRWRRGGPRSCQHRRGPPLTVVPPCAARRRAGRTGAGAAQPVPQRPRPHHVTSASASTTMNDDILDSPAVRSTKRDRHLHDARPRAAWPGRSSRSGSRSPRPGSGRGRAGAGCRRRVGAVAGGRVAARPARARRTRRRCRPGRAGAGARPSSGWIRPRRSGTRWPRRSPARAAPQRAAARPGRARSRRRSRRRRRSRARVPRRSRPGRRCPAPTCRRAASRWTSGSSAATALTSSAVPSGLPSSTTSTPASGRHSGIRCSMRSMFSDSL